MRNFQFFAKFCDGHRAVPRMGACATHCPKNQDIQYTNNYNNFLCVALLANACFEVFLVSTIKDKPSFRWVCWIKDKNDKLDWAILSQYVNESLSEYQYLFLAAIMSFIIIMSCTINLNKVIWKAYFWKKLLSMQNANVNPFLHKLTVRISMK